MSIVTTTKRYSWTYKTYRYSVTLTIPSSVYDEYAKVSFSKRQTNRFTRFGYMITTKDPTCQLLATRLSDAAKGLRREEQAQFIINFISQCINYKADSDTTPYPDYSRFPIETLYLGYGDCEDTTALAITLLTILGYETLLFAPTGHYSLGIKGNFTGTHVNGYYYSETHGPLNINRVIGNCPKEYRNQLQKNTKINPDEQHTITVNEVSTVTAVTANFDLSAVLLSFIAFFDKIFLRFAQK